MDYLESINEQAFNKLNFVSKSNYLISSKFSSTLLENKLLLLSLQRVQQNSKGQWISSITAPEIKMLLRKDYSEFYVQLRRTALRMLKNVIMIEDPETKSFHASNIISDAYSREGNFTVIFNPNMSTIVTSLKENFTVLNVGICCDFDSVAAFRLYEILKSKCYYPKGMERKNNLFEIEFDINELKVTMGAVDMSDPKVADIINGKANPDYERALKEVAKLSEKDNSVKKPKWNTWYDFKKQILDKAIEEINKKADLDISYDTIQKGHGGKVSKVIFTVKLLTEKNKTENTQTAISQEERFTFIEKADEILESNLSIKDIKNILEKANYDLDKVQKAYDLSKKQTQINNLTGWLIKAIEEQYEEPVPKKGKSKKAYGDFMERQYDFEELESQLVSNK